MSEQIEKNHTRRGFLTKIGSYAVSGVVSSAVGGIIAPGSLMTGAVLFSDSLFDEEETKRMILESENKHVYLVDNTSSFINIGVLHVATTLDEQLKNTIMKQSIEESDIVLLETGDSYFGKIQKHCEEKEKKVINMDVSRGITSDTIGIVATFISTLGILDLYRKDIIRLGNSSSPEEKKKIRGQYLQQCLSLLGIAQLGIFPPSFIASMILSGENEYKAQYDISHTGDARTVFMAIQVLKSIKENPGKKILAISGNGHARGIHYYLYEAGGQREFKNIIYNIVYGIFKLLP